MAAEGERIAVTEESQGAFRVEVHGRKQTTTHTVRVNPDMVAALGWTGPQADLVRESFSFLLEREPQTSILRSFDLDVIGRYFPEYPAEISRLASGTGDQSS